MSEDLVIALRLARGGWWGSDPGAVMRAPADEVMAALRYDDFVGRYEAEMVRLNRGDTSK